MKIIPAIDVIDGKCVRLSQGDYDTKKIYNENPLDVAKEFEDYGIEYLHLVDLDVAKSKQIINYKILEQITTKTNLKVDFGGGIKSDDDVRIAFECGANQITGGSIAVQNPTLFEEWISKYGTKKIILGADAKDRKVATLGWLETWDLDVVAFIKNYNQKEIEYVICTDIAKNGMLQCTSNALYTEILENCDVRLIASGGVSSMDDLIELKEFGCEGAILGKAIYEGKISLKHLKQVF
ncbi:1-(5-phosphoribosyl)-5-[(5-phosphoribosylamino)methylideneamino]imidazole-4-carboxamide isomerase [Chryseobacterium sp. TY3]